MERTTNQAITGKGIPSALCLTGALRLSCVPTFPIFFLMEFSFSFLNRSGLGRNLGGSFN